jgi:hypothetical protein
MEQQKIQLVEFITENGLKVPKALRSKLQTDTVTVKSSSSVAKTMNDKARAILQKQSTKISGDKGYAEEIDIEVYNHPTSSVSYEKHPNDSGLEERKLNSRQYKKEHHNATVYEDDEDNEEEEEDHHQNHYPSSSKDTSKLSSNLSHSQQSLRSSKPGDVFNLLSNNLKSGFSSSTATTKSLTQSSSWNVRASKSSTRYSSSVEDENEENDNYDNYYRNPVGTEQDDDRSKPEHGDEDFDYDKMNERKSLKNSTKKDSLSPTISSLSMKFPITKSSGTTLSSHPYVNDTLSHKTSSAAAASDSARGASASSSVPSSPSQSSSNRIEEVKPDGTRIIHYRNGTSKEVSPAGQSLVKFTNGDTKFTDPVEGKVVYFYQEANTTHTTYNNGMELYEFPNGQVSEILFSAFYLLFIFCFLLS